MERDRGALFGRSWVFLSLWMVVVGTVGAAAVLALEVDPGAGASALAPPPAWTPGSLLVSAGSANQINSYDASTGTWRGLAASAPPLNYPNGLLIGPDGNLYLIQEGGDNVLRYNGRTGEYMGVFASGAPLDYMIGGTFGPDGNLYVCSYAQSGVLKISGQTGAYLGTITRTGGFGAIGAAFGPDGKLYATSLFSGEILRFDGVTGAYEGVFASGLNTPTALAFAPNGFIYVCQRDASLLSALASDGHVAATISCSAELGMPESLLVGPDGDLYVSSISTYRVCRYDIPAASAALTYTDTVVPGATGLTTTRGMAFLPIPEPGTAGLLLAGAAMMVWGRRLHRPA